MNSCSSVFLVLSQPRTLTGKIATREVMYRLRLPSAGPHLARLTWRLQTFIADHDSPGLDLPLGYEATRHVRISPSEGVDDRRIVGAEHEQRPVGWCAERPSQHDFAAPVGILRQPQVLRPEWLPAGREVLNHVVEQDEVRHTLTCLCPRIA